MSPGLLARARHAYAPNGVGRAYIWVEGLGQEPEFHPWLRARGLLRRQRVRIDRGVIQGMPTGLGYAP